MPKSVDVEDFAAKLALLTKRLNWSRAKLAQQVGVDKSLAARWLNGNSRPTGNSLMQLTTAVAQNVAGFTAADWDLRPEQFARRLGIEAAPRVAATGGHRLRIEGLRNPPPATWGLRLAGLWGGFYQSFTNRGVARMCAVEFRPEGDNLYFGFTDGSFLCEGSAIATHAHVHAICEIAPLDNHLIFVTLNAAPDVKGPSVIDGLASTFAADAMPSCAPLLLFRIGLETDDPSIDLRALMPRVTDANDGIEKAAARTGDPFAATQQYAPAEILGGLFPQVGVARADGQTDHVLRLPPSRSLATGEQTMGNLPTGAPLRAVPAKLRRALGLDPPEAIRLVHSVER